MMDKRNTRYAKRVADDVLIVVRVENFHSRYVPHIGFVNLSMKGDVTLTIIPKTPMTVPPLEMGEVYAPDFVKTTMIDIIELWLRKSDRLAQLYPILSAIPPMLMFPNTFQPEVPEFVE
jgi:hypothetical protein